MAGKHTRTPARDKVRQFIPQALAGKWSASKLAKEAGVGRSVATAELKSASSKNLQEMDSKLSSQNNEALRVANNLNRAQARRAARIDALSEQILGDLEEKAEKHHNWTGKEEDRPPGLNGREVETLVKLQSQQWQHVKDMAGITVAEKLIISQAKGEAQGQAITSALLDATAIDVSAQVWDTEDVQEAEIVGE